MHARSLLRTGWGPRGDSDSARGRVRATQPATFSFLLPSAFQTSRLKEGLHAGSLFSFASSGIRRAIYGRHVGDFSMRRFQINRLWETAWGNLKGWLDR
jgi:hypothetical protein